MLRCFEILGCGVSPENRLTEREMPESSDSQSAFQLWFFSKSWHRSKSTRFLAKCAPLPPSFFLSVFLSCAHLFSMCPVVWKRPDQSRADVTHQSISFHSVSFVARFIFPLVNSTTGCLQVSVFSAREGSSHVGHWLECSKWVTEWRPGFLFCSFHHF